MDASVNITLTLIFDSVHLPKVFFRTLFFFNIYNIVADEYTPLE